MQDKTKTDKSAKQEESQEEEGKVVPPATTGEVLKYLRSCDYHFSASEKTTGLIAIPKDRGEGTKIRKVSKSVLNDIEGEKEFLKDYERLLGAFNGFSWARKKREGAGRPTKTKQEYVEGLKRLGVQSSGAGILTLNVAKLFELPETEIKNRAGEDVSGYEQALFKFDWNEENQEIRITKDRRKK